MKCRIYINNIILKRPVHAQKNTYMHARIFQTYKLPWTNNWDFSQYG